LIGPLPRLDLALQVNLGALLQEPLGDAISGSLKITTRCHSVRSLRSPLDLSFQLSDVAIDRLQISIRSALSEPRVFSEIADKDDLLQSPTSCGLLRKVDLCLVLHLRDRRSHVVWHGDDIALEVLPEAGQFVHVMALRSWPMISLQRALAHIGGMVLLGSDGGSSLPGEHRAQLGVFTISDDMGAALATTAPTGYRYCRGSGNSQRTPARLKASEMPPSPLPHRVTGTIAAPDPFVRRS